MCTNTLIFEKLKKKSLKKKFKKIQIDVKSKSASTSPYLIFKLMSQVKQIRDKF